MGHTFAVLSCSSSTLACKAAEACLYSSSRWYAAKDDARENPNRKPTILERRFGEYNGKNAQRTYPPRMPPMGRFGGGVEPTLATTASRRGGEVERRRDWQCLAVDLHAGRSIEAMGRIGTSRAIEHF